MTENNVVTSMKVRAISRDRFSIVLTHKDGNRTGYAVTAMKTLEIIDNIKLR